MNKEKNMHRKETSYYDIDVDIDETLLKMGLVDDIFYVRDLKQRKLFLTANVDQFSIGDITKHIMQYNAEDKSVPVEQRQPILLYVASNGGGCRCRFRADRCHPCKQNACLHYQSGIPVQHGILNWTGRS